MLQLGRLTLHALRHVRPALRPAIVVTAPQRASLIAVQVQREGKYVLHPQKSSAVRVLLSAC